MSPADPSAGPPGPVRAATARLRTQGALLRARPQAEVVESLATVLDAWSDGAGHRQRELAPRLAESSGFSEATVRNGLRDALNGWNGAALRRVVSREFGPPAAEGVLGHELTSVLLAGCIPMPTLLQILLVLAVRSPALVKMASRDRVTAHAVRQSIELVDRQLARCVEVLGPDAIDDESAKAAFFSSPCVIASGSDETIDAVRERLSHGHSLVAYGHRLSISVIGCGGLDQATARGLAADVAAWDQLGCLSPAVAFVVGAEENATSKFASYLAARLEELEREAPRGTIDSASAAAIRSERDSARLRFAHNPAGGGRVLASTGTEWTVVLEPDCGVDATLRAAPAHRFLRIHCVRDVAALERLAAPLVPWLSTIASAGLSGAEQAALTRLGGHRMCRPGEMQTPELGWHRDGVALLAPLIP